MATMIDYLHEYGTATFAEAPLSVVDAAILAQLAYCAFTPHTSGRLGSLTPQAQARLVQGTWQEAGNRQLLAAAAASPRYRNVQWLAPVARLDADRQQEFSAVTFALAPQLYYVSYRGTRASFVDWKEDFNMTFLAAIPSQQAALAYFATVYTQHPGTYYLGGHSKGGTLAAYAYVNAEPALQKNVLYVYNFDGPGLRQLHHDPKLLKLVPEASVVGMILEPGQDFGVVTSNARGWRQHDLLSWPIRARDFEYLPATSRRSQQLQALLLNWLDALDDTTKQQALDAIYQVLSQTDAATFSELTATPTQSAKAILAGLHTTSADDHAAWRAVADGLAKAVLATLRH
ncbi:Mbeg1-like protein [Lacticaseibacillus jixiensis]|uniref:Mbeg1-like protein n=1 Tax=Lacticaseibacillus jixiensis TaxID=3231926 RepID=UPI0036F37C6B